MTAPSTNRTYQQLRSHLVYLKLDAAAELTMSSNAGLVQSPISGMA
jgi:hypothetical protein